MGEVEDSEAATAVVVAMEWALVEVRPDKASGERD